MKALPYILGLHVALLVLASSDFTILSFWGEGASFSWNYATYSYRNGFGGVFVSEYTLLQVLAYLGAYISGVVVFGIAYRKGWWMVGLSGLGLCGLGGLSFLIEGSHWVVEHHLSWIASFPVGVIVLWAFLAVALVREGKRTSVAEREG